MRRGGGDRESEAKRDSNKRQTSELSGKAVKRGRKVDEKRNESRDNGNKE